jgi:hypothetical protein
MPREKGSGQFTKKPKMIGPKRKSTKQWPELNPENAKDQKGKHEVSFMAKKEAPGWMKKRHPDAPISPTNKRIRFWARNG